MSPDCRRGETAAARSETSSAFCRRPISRDSVFRGLTPQRVERPLAWSPSFDI